MHNTLRWVGYFTYSHTGSRSVVSVIDVGLLY